MMNSYPSNNNSYVVNASLAANYNGPTVAKEGMPYVFAQAVMSGTFAGTLYLQSSADGTNWATISGSSQSASAAGTYQWNLSGQANRYWRIAYTYTSGTATLNSQYNMF